jgi:hypothetical protein
MLVRVVQPALSTTNGFNTDHEVSGAGQDTAIVKQPKENSVWAIDQITYSYSGAGTAEGGLIIKDGDKVIFDIDLMNNQGGVPLYIVSSPNKPLEIRLKSGGSGMIGKLNTSCHLESA